MEHDGGCPIERRSVCTLGGRRLCGKHAEIVSTGSALLIVPSVVVFSRYWLFIVPWLGSWFVGLRWWHLSWHNTVRLEVRRVDRVDPWHEVELHMCWLLELLSPCHIVLHGNLAPDRVKDNAPDRVKGLMCLVLAEPCLSVVLVTETLRWKYSY